MDSMELFVCNQLEIGGAVRRVGRQTAFTLTEIVGSIWIRDDYAYLRTWIT